MSQKELNYLEDIYNHEKLIINIITKEMECMNDDTYKELFNSQLERHEKIIKKLNKYMEGLI